MFPLARQASIDLDTLGNKIREQQANLREHPVLVQGQHTQARESHRALSADTRLIAGLTPLSSRRPADWGFYPHFIFSYRQQAVVVFRGRSLRL